MTYLQICAAADGESYLQDQTWPMSEGDFTPPSPAGYSISETYGAHGVLMMHHPAGYVDEWHCAPKPVLGAVLRGHVRIQTSDGDVRILPPGAQFVATDLHGKGHKIEESNGQPYDLSLILLEKAPG